MTTKKSNAVRLTDEAFGHLGEMLRMTLEAEPGLKMNNFKLISYIVSDYKERYFIRSRERISEFHRDKKSDARNMINTLSDIELENVIRYLDKISKDASVSP